jgi:cardiolipin synthase (CMP-forming)
MKTTENKFSIPNILSFYRLFAIPFIIWSLMAEDRTIFIVLISINLITDILDGYIARRYNLCTEFGARLDSMADIGTFLLSISGFLVFEKPFVQAHGAAFLLLLGSYLTGQILSIIKFKRTTSFHLYSNKFSGYVQGFFIFIFFVFGYQPYLFYFMIVVGFLAEIEVILLVLILPKLISNARSIFLINKNL